MTSESLVAAALDTMPEQRQAIADGVATEETYEAVAGRVAVLEALGKGCAGLAEIDAEDLGLMQQHVFTCALCKPADPKRLRERVEYIAPGLVAVPDDEERRWLAFLNSPVRTVSDVVTRPVRALTDLVTKNSAVLTDPHVWKAAAAVVGFVVFLVAMPSSERVEPPTRNEAQAVTDPTETPPGNTPPPVAGPSVSAAPPATGTNATGTNATGVNGTTGTTGTNGTTKADDPVTGGTSTEDKKIGAWAYATTSMGQYDQAVGQEVELNPRWQWGTWRRNGIERYVTLIRQGEGDYVVRVPEVSGGTVHAELSLGWGYYQPFSCQTEGTRADGRDLLVDVACFNPNGTRKNLPFTVVFVSDGPAVRYRGGASGVVRTGTGQYEVTTLGGNGFAMVSPVGQYQARCRSTVEATRIKVACDTDSDWNLTYTSNAIHHDLSAPAASLETGSNRSWSSNGETPTVTRTAVGRYDVQYKSIGNPKVWPGEAVLVSASGPEPRYCRIWAWNGYSYPPGVLVQVYCFDQAGAAADATFALAYLRSP
ncbi:hypothetical protein [Lentzea flava]|uniref:hypothetical protein n=1 Tax=Lentzea flava TaxID=103732 RepID=UPI0016713DCC|nr:hypothetical protein [Lentzea flava]